MDYNFFSSFVIRLPFLPFTGLQPALNNKDSLLYTLSLPSVQEAIYLASPVLYKELQKLMEGKITNEKEKERILFSSERYLTRMSTRCTPYGLFAGCGIGKIGDQTEMEVSDSITRVTRLDMYYLSALYDTLVKIPQVKENIRFLPNNSLYKVGKKYRYIEVKYTNSGRKYQISEVEQSSYLNRLLKLAIKGEKIKTLVTVLTDKDISEDEAMEFINELIDSRILVPELNDSVTGNDFFTRIIHLLEIINCSDLPLHNRLKEIKKQLDELDTTDNTLEIYRQIISIVEEIKIPYKEKFLFQVDLFCNMTRSLLGMGVVEELRSVLTFLNKITPMAKNETLDRFRQDFYSRYEEQEIPLMEALDPEMGLGYPSRNNSSILSPLIDDLILPQSGKMNRKESDFWSILFRKVVSSDQYCREIEITDEDIQGLEADWSDLPPTIFAMFEVIRSGSEDILIRIKSCAGSCGANLLGRFAHLEEKMEQLVKDITYKEQELMSEVILAEIVHSPEARTGNVLFRPHVRDYELLYISDSDLPRERLILLSDLMLSVKQNRLVIRSKKLNKEILPRLTTAHNFHFNTMPVYKFLCDMQTQQGRNELYFNWRQGNEKYSFLPRLRYRNTIFFPATWIVKGEEIKYFFEIEKEEILMDSIKEWRNNRFMPQYVLLADGDNELFIDWENCLSVRSLFSMIKKRPQVKFTEFLFEPTQAMIKDKNGSYPNECIIAFYKEIN